MVNFFSVVPLPCDRCDSHILVEVVEVFVNKQINKADTSTTSTSKCESHPSHGNGTTEASY